MEKRLRTLPEREQHFIVVDSGDNDADYEIARFGHLHHAVKLAANLYRQTYIKAVTDFGKNYARENANNIIADFADGRSIDIRY